MAQRRTRKPKETFDPFLATWEWVRTRVLRERSQKREDEYKKRLLVFLEEEGDKDESGHRTYLFDEPLVETGLGSAPTIIGIKRERRESTTLNEDRAMKLLGAKGLLHQCTATVTVINEDAILAANFNGSLTDQELSSMYDTTESFAFIPLKQKAK